MIYKDFSAMSGMKVEKPFERELKVILSPETDEEVKDFTFIISTLAPHGGCTDFHGHDDAGELMIFMSGTGKAWVGDTEYELKPGVAIYAPAGVQHKTLNTGSVPLEIACVFTPAISTSYVLKNMQAAKKAQA
jgi:mannose-6-phosphate isomerase-like protein (cupin superfamily)